MAYFLVPPCLRIIFISKVTDFEILENRMIRIFVVLAFAVCFSLVVNGSESHAPVFMCETKNNKNIEVYKDGDMVTYSFGRGGYPPELTLTQLMSDVEIAIGNISGNEISNSITFSNGAYTYRVITAINRVAATQEPRHGVLVKKKSKYLTYIACVPDTAQGSLLDLE